MVHYHVGTPKKEGDIYVVEIKECMGNGVLRTTKVRVRDFAKMVKTIFHTLPYQYEMMIKEEK